MPVSARRALPLLAAVLLPLAFAGVAAAAPADEAITLKVNSADLHTAAGAKALALRIRVAAASACGADVDPIVRRGDGFYRCQADAIDRAVGKVDAPLLAAALGIPKRQLAGEPH